MLQCHAKLHQRPDPNSSQAKQAPLPPPPLPIFSPRPYALSASQWVSGLTLPLTRAKQCKFSQAMQTELSNASQAERHFWRRRCQCPSTSAAPQLPPPLHQCPRIHLCQCPDISIATAPLTPPKQCCSCMLPFFVRMEQGREIIWQSRGGGVFF